MASVLLPVSPGPRRLAWEQIDFGGVLQGSLGGAGQRVNRPGNRWRLTVVLPAMSPRLAAEWAVDLSRGLRMGVLWRIRQAGFSGSGAGTPLVMGAGQSGTTLAVDGMTVGHPLRKGKAFSILTGERHYLHRLAAHDRVNSSGQASFDIEPPLRVSPADNAPIELAVPYIEGLLEGLAAEEIDERRLVQGFSFTIAETR